jgi:hypothetical protein
LRSLQTLALPESLESLETPIPHRGNPATGGGYRLVNPGHTRKLGYAPMAEECIWFTFASSPLFLLYCIHVWKHPHQQGFRSDVHTPSIGGLKGRLSAPQNAPRLKQGKIAKLLILWRPI